MNVRITSSHPPLPSPQGVFIRRVHTLISRGLPVAANLLSSSLPPPQDPTSPPQLLAHAYYLELAGDALYTQRLPKEALTMYRQSSQVHYQIPPLNPSSDVLDASAHSLHLCSYKTALCHLHSLPPPPHQSPPSQSLTCDYIESEILPLLASIPKRYRSPTANLLMARLQICLAPVSPPASASEAYLDAIRSDPSVVLELGTELIPLLSNGTLNKSSVYQTFSESVDAAKMRRSHPNPSSPAGTNADLDLIVEIGTSIINSAPTPERDIPALLSCANSHPESSSIASLAAMCPGVTPSERLALLRRSFDLLPNKLSNTDTLAYLTFKGLLSSPNPDPLPLSQLSLKTLQISPSAPEPWTIAGMYASLHLPADDVLTLLPPLTYPASDLCPPQGQYHPPPPKTHTSTKEHALTLNYLNKSLSLRPTPIAYLVKADVLLTLGRLHEASTCYKKAQACSSNFALGDTESHDLSYGAVRAALRLGMQSEALLHSKSYNNRARTPHSLGCVGLALAHSPDPSKAIPILTRSLNSTPVTSTCPLLYVATLTQLHLSANSPALALAVLERALSYLPSTQSDVYIHTHLGISYAMLNRRGDALTHFHTAVGLGGAEAVDGLERLEKGVRGIRQDEDDGDSLY